MIWDNFRNIAALSSVIESEKLARLLINHDFEGIKSQYNRVRSFFEDDDGYSPYSRRQQYQNDQTLANLPNNSDFTFYGDEQLLAKMLKLSGKSQKLQNRNLETNCHGTTLYLLGKKSEPDMTLYDSFGKKITCYEPSRKIIPSLVTLEDRTNEDSPFIAHSGLFCATEANNHLIYHQKGTGYHHQFDRIEDVIAQVQNARPTIQINGKTVVSEFTIHYYAIPEVLENVA